MTANRLIMRGSRREDREAYFAHAIIRPRLERGERVLIAAIDVRAVIARFSRYFPGALFPIVAGGFTIRLRK